MPADSVFEEFIRSNRGRAAVSEHEVKALFEGKGFSVPRRIFLKVGEALPAHISLKFPLIAKVSSPAIPSKSTRGGIRTGINTLEDLETSVRTLSQLEQAEGVLIEETAPPGLEVIVGGVIENQFGPVVMFGLGGILVELFEDIAFALAPLTEKGALWLIRQVKGSKLLEGYRGNPPIDKASLVDTLVAVSGMMATGLIQELDLNPLALYPQGAVILDAKMQLVISPK